MCFQWQSKFSKNWDAITCEIFGKWNSDKSNSASTVVARLYSDIKNNGDISLGVHEKGLLTITSDFCAGAIKESAQTDHTALMNGASTRDAAYGTRHRRPSFHTGSVRAGKRTTVHGEW